MNTWAGLFNGELNLTLGKNYGSNVFSKEKITVLIKYCSDYSWKKPVNPN